MKSNLHLTALQIPLVWEAPQTNRAYIDVQLQAISNPTDLILLPEMFTTGFTMHPEKIAESMDGPTVQWMRLWAERLEAALAGSIVIQEGGQFFNRMLFVCPDGTLHYYDKHHTFTLAGEDQVYTAGRQAGIITYMGWKICLRICYDLRFPVWSRNTQDYDLLIYVANWPTARIQAWDTLLQARAIENMSFVAGVNRIGQDEKGHTYPGHTALYDGLGKRLSGALSTAEKAVTAELNYLELQALRKRLRFLEDRDNFEWC